MRISDWSSDVCSSDLLYKSENIRLPSPGQCIYCGNSKSNLRHEHVIPYALAANTMILEKSCCETCQNVIQRYEQEVLKKQLGVFRTQVDAPSRSRKKERITHDIGQVSCRRRVC